MTLDANKGCDSASAVAASRRRVERVTNTARVADYSKTEMQTIHIRVVYDIRQQHQLMKTENESKLQLT